MNITREDLPGRQVALTIELDPDTVSAALDRAYRQVVNQVDIPGFRRGKAPRPLVESYLGKDYLVERAVKNILPKALQDAIAEQNIDALDVGEVDIISTDPLQIKVVVVQKPVVELGDYRSIRVQKEPTEVTDEQVEEVLAELRREGAPWQELSEPRPIKEGDMVYLDLEGFTTEGELGAAKRENFPTIVGLERAGVPESVNRALVGMQVGEEKDVADVLPEDYPVESLRGKDVTYHVTVRSVKEQQLPELNDQFAQQHGFDSLQALRDAVERNLRRRAEDAAESNQIAEVIRQLVQGAVVEVPDMLVDEELDLMLRRLEERLKEQRITLRQFFTYNGITEQEWRNMNRERARERLIRGLVLQEFARREGIAVEEGDVEREVERVLETFEEQEKDRARSLLQRDEMRDRIEDQIYERKIRDRLVAIAEGRATTQTEGQTQAQAGSGAEAEAREAPQAQTAPEPAPESPAQNTQGTAGDLAQAGGAAELLGTEGVDTRSEHETGRAPGGGTPTTAPGLGGE